MRAVVSAQSASGHNPDSAVARFEYIANGGVGQSLTHAEVGIIEAVVTTDSDIGTEPNITFAVLKYAVDCVVRQPGIGCIELESVDLRLSRRGCEQAKKRSRYLSHIEMNNTLFPVEKTMKNVLPEIYAANADPRTSA